MTAATIAKPKKKRIPKRMSADDLQKLAETRSKKDGYHGVNPQNVKWDTLRFDEKLKRQCVIISTVDENGKADDNTREVATSDLQHVRHTVELSKILKSKRQNAKRSEKRKNK